MFPIHHDGLNQQKQSNNRNHFYDEVYRGGNNRIALGHRIPGKNDSEATGL